MNYKILNFQRLKSWVELIELTLLALHIYVFVGCGVLKIL